MIIKPIGKKKVNIYKKASKIERSIEEMERDIPNPWVRVHTISV